MKKIFFLTISLCAFYSVFAQAHIAADNEPEYLRNPYIPAFQVFKAPDSTAFTNENLDKKKPVLLMIFSPECGHCQNTTTELLKNIDHFNNVQIVMTTWLPYSEMLTFYNTNKIADYPQITMGWDKKDFFLPYYHVQSYPGLFAYDKDGKFVKSFSGDIQMEQVSEALGN